jgi:hypothetical protein
MAGNLKKDRYIFPIIIILCLMLFGWFMEYSTVNSKALLLVATRTLPNDYDRTATPTVPQRSGTQTRCPTYLPALNDVNSAYIRDCSECIADFASTATSMPQWWKPTTYATATYNLWTAVPATATATPATDYYAWGLEKWGEQCRDTYNSPTTKTQCTSITSLDVCGKANAIQAWYAEIGSDNGLYRTTFGYQSDLRGREYWAGDRYYPVKKLGSAEGGVYPTSSQYTNLYAQWTASGITGYISLDHAGANYINPDLEAYSSTGHYVTLSNYKFICRNSEKRPTPTVPASTPFVIPTFSPCGTLYPETVYEMGENEDGESNGSVAMGIQNDAIKPDGQVYAVNLDDGLTWYLDFQINAENVTSITLVMDKLQRSSLPDQKLDYFIWNQDGNMFDVDHTTPLTKNPVSLYSGAPISISKIRITNGSGGDGQPYGYVYMDGLEIIGCRGRTQCERPENNMPVYTDFGLPYIEQGECHTFLPPMTNITLFGVGGSWWNDIVERLGITTLTIPEFTFRGLEICPQYVHLGRLAIGTIVINYSDVLVILIMMGFIRNIFRMVGQ